MEKGALLPWRRAFHWAAGTALAATLSLPLGWALGVVGGLSALALTAEGARFLSPHLNARFLALFRPLLKAEEKGRFTGASFMVWGALASLLLFGPEAAQVGVLVQAWGDPAGATAGILWGRRRLPRGKTIEGSVAYLMAGAMAGLALGGAGLVAPWWAGLAGAGVAAPAEALSPPPDDNFWGPVVAGGSVWALGLL